MLLKITWLLTNHCGKKKCVFGRVITPFNNQGHASQLGKTLIVAKLEPSVLVDRPQPDRAASVKAAADRRHCVTGIH